MDTDRATCGRMGGIRQIGTNDTKSIAKDINHLMLCLDALSKNIRMNRMNNLLSVIVLLVLATWRKSNQTVVLKGTQQQQSLSNIK